MQKILALTEKHFATGIAPSSNTQTRGLWYKAKGITIFRDPFLESDNFGLLQAAPSPTDITPAGLGVPWAWATDVSGASNRYLYVWDNGGNLFQLDISGDNTPTKVSTVAVSSPAAGVLHFQHNDGTKRVYYFQLTQIGRWDPTAAWTTRTDNYKIGLTSTEYHPPHQLFDRVYFANGRYIGSLVDDGAGGFTLNATALDVDADDRVNCLSDDGVYLVAGITKNQSTDNLVHGKSRVIFWDTNQSSWQREWPIPDASIQAIRRVGNVMEAVTSRGVFAFTFNTPPQPVLPLMAASAVPSLAYPAHYNADVLSGAIVFGGSTRLSSFGKLVPSAPTAYFQPFAGFTGDVSIVATTAKTNDVYVGTASSKFYRVKLTGAGQTGVSAETIFIDLKRWYQVGRIDVFFDGQLAIGDSVSITGTADDATSGKSFGTISYATYGAIRSKESYASIEASRLKITITFNGGTPRIRGIDVYGDPITTPTHTRA